MTKKDKKDTQFEQPSDILLLFDRYIIYIIAFIVLTVLASGYFFVLEPKISDISSTEEETTISEDRRVANEKLLSQLKELEAEYQDIINNRQEDLTFLKKMIPYDAQVAELFLISERLAQRHDFQVLNIDISPNSQSNKSKASDTTGDSSGDIVTIDDLLSDSGIKSMLVKLNVSKTIGEDDGISGVDVYNDFKDYLAELENNLRLLDVQAINFSPIDAEFEGDVTYTFDLDMITYYQ